MVCHVGFAVCFFFFLLGASLICSSDLGVRVVRSMGVWGYRFCRRDYFHAE